MTSAGFARPKIVHALRYLARPREHPRRLCTACIRQSLHHPAGLRRNYTRNRVAGIPICPRHSLAEAATILPHHQIGQR